MPTAASSHGRLAAVHSLPAGRLRMQRLQLLLSRNLPAGENGKEIQQGLGQLVEMQLADLGLDKVRGWTLARLQSAWRFLYGPR